MVKANEQPTNCNCDTKSHVHCQSVPTGDCRCQRWNGKRRCARCKHGDDPGLQKRQNAVTQTQQRALSKIDAARAHHPFPVAENARTFLLRSRKPLLFHALKLELACPLVCLFASFQEAAPVSCIDTCARASFVIWSPAAASPVPAP
jgi:hypothetical protein